MTRRAEEIDKRKLERATERRVIGQIAGFGARVSDLIATFGELSSEERAGGGVYAEGFEWISEEEIEQAVAGCRERGLVEVDELDGEESLYIATDRGMCEAGYASWTLGLSPSKGSWLLERGGARGRMVAAVGAALARAIATDPKYLRKLDGEGSETRYRQRYELWSMWKMRKHGRKADYRYMFQLALRGRNQALGGRNHYPAGFLHQSREKRERGLLIEIFEESMSEMDIAKICRGWNSRANAVEVWCYVSPDSVEQTVKAIKRLGAEEKLWVFPIPCGASAEAVKAAVALRGLQRSEREIAREQQIAACIGKARVASVAGISEYLQIAEAEIAEVVREGLAEGWLERSECSYDGVALYWLSSAEAQNSECPAAAGHVTVSAAGFGKERLRVAGALKAEYAGWSVKWGSVGYDEGQPALIAEHEEADSAVMVVRMAMEIRSRRQLEEAVERWSEQAGSSQTMVYALPALVGPLEDVVRSRGFDSFMAIRRLPESERLEESKAAERKRQVVAERSEERESRRAQVARRRAEPKRRSEVSAIDLPEMKPVGEELWVALNERFEERLGKSAGHSVSLRLVVNVLIWLMENEQSISYVTSETCQIAGVTFRGALYRIYDADLWEAMKELLASHESACGEPLRKTLHWSSVDITRYKRPASTYHPRDEKTEANPSEMTLEYLAELRLEAL